jgi:hypothetical protein
MPTRSRTYLPTDWQVWTYKPVAGKFRLDFSALNGADVLGGVSDLGSIQLLDIPITAIQLDDGQRPDQGVFFTFTPGTMSLSSQIVDWDETLVKELYNGKQIFLTLKNEASTNHGTFGKNTVFFIGQIDNLDINVDPINFVTTLTISATDITGAALNVPITVTKGVSKGLAIEAGFVAAQTAGQISQYLDFDLFAILGTSWEFGGTYTTTFGNLMIEYIQGEVAEAGGFYQQYKSGPTVYIVRNIYGRTIAANSLAGRLIPDDITTNIVFSQDGANSPTAFDLSNALAVYSYGTSSASILTNPTIYTATMDVETLALLTIADKISEFTQKIQPTEVTVRTARSYQEIVFDNPAGGGSEYFYPVNFYFNGEEVKTTPAFTGGTYYHTIVGTSHTITPDDWQTTYQLWKGL